MTLSPDPLTLAAFAPALLGRHPALPPRRGVVSYALLYFGLQKAPAGTGSLILATLPIFTFALALLHGLERSGVRPLVAAAIAAVGAEAGVVAKRFPWTHPLSTNAVGMLVGGIIVGALSLATSEAHSLRRGSSSSSGAGPRARRPMRWS